MSCNDLLALFSNSVFTIAKMSCIILFVDSEYFYVEKFIHY